MSPPIQKSAAKTMSLLIQKSATKKCVADDLKIGNQKL